METRTAGLEEILTIARTSKTFDQFRERITIVFAFVDAIVIRANVSAPDGTVRFRLHEDERLDQLRQYVLRSSARIAHLHQWNATLRFLGKVLCRFPLRFVRLLFSVRWWHVGRTDVDRHGLDFLARALGYDGIHFFDLNDGKFPGGMLLFSREVLVPVTSVRGLYRFASGT